MKKRILQMKWTKRIVLIVMLFGVAGLGKMYAQNLIVNSDFESGNTGFITDYSYTATGVVGEGYYCIDVTAQGHGGGTLGGWPDIRGYGGSGKYMLVNGHGGATNPTKIVWKQTVNVTANTDYIFSCQVVNLAQLFFGYSPNPAILRLKINGSNVGSDWTIAQNNEWHEWSNSWSSGSATQAIIEIYDVYTGNSGLGDDFGLDHFQLTPQATYSVNAFDDFASVCLYNLVQIDVLANDIITPSGQQSGATVQIIQSPQHGTATWNNNTRKIQYMFIDASYSGDLDQFKYRVTIPHGEMSEAWVYVTTSKQPSVGWINPPATICAGAPLGIPTPTVEPAQGTGQWEYCQTQNGMYSPIPDPNNVPFSMNSNWVRYSVTNDCGESHSNSVLITVKDAPSIGTIQAPPAINAGGSFNLTQPAIQPNGSPIFNQGWQIAATQNGNYSPFNNNNVPYSYNGYWIRYFADNDCGVGYSNAVQITVYQNDNNITFADANVKAICVANWDTNGDGELSYVEAAAVTYLGQVFRSTTITSFDELQYFINLTSIENYSFNGCASLASIVIPNSVTSIGVFAFSDCSSLTSIEIPNFVTSIGEWAFSWCTGVASLEIPNSVSSIGEMAFYGCNSLTSLEIPNSVTSIGEMAFYACSSLSLVISYPSTPPALGENVFYNTPNNNMSIFVYCGALEAYQLASGWSTYNLRGMCSGEVTATANPTEGGTISGTGWYEDDQICTLVATANDGYVFAYWMENGNLVSSEATYSIPVSGDRTFVALFMQEGNIVFADDNVKSICVAHWDTNHDGELSYAEAAAVANLGQVFSYNTAITSFDELQYFINLNSIVNYEGWLSGCFSGCTNLASIEIPNSVSSIGEMAFSGCCSLTSIEIPTSVTSIGDHAFSGCTGLTSIEIPNSVAYIQSGAFSGCSSLVQMVVESGNTEYDSRGNCNAIIETSTNELVAGCKTTVIPNTVTSIGWAAFSSCTSLTSIEIPNSVTSIKNYAFSGCSGLTSIEIPNSVTSIGYYAFYDCSSLSLIISYPSTPPSLGDNVFYNTPSNMSVFVPCGALEAYQLANGWNTLSLREMCAGEITATANPTEGGTVTGSGYYEGGTTCTLKATPDEGYLFLNWSKEGQVVSSDSIYSFIVAGDADFVANFAEEGDVCALTFDLFDSYGDGYTGNYLVVTDENGISQRLTIESGSSAVYTIPFLNGSHLALTWLLGSYPEDCSFTVSYSNGYVIYHCENLNESFSYEFDVDCVFSPMDNIIFADTNVKAICVANWDTNGDGELSYAEAAAVTDLGQVFRGNTEITSFEELRDFVGLNSIGDYEFFNCHGLTSIEIPNSVISIGIGAFRNCSSMARMVVESGNTVYDSRGNCNSIIKTSTNELVAGCKNTIIPNSVTSIGNNAFTSCIGLTSITIPNSVTSIGYSAFSYCTYLTSITIPDPVSFIGNNAFYHCTSLTSISICNSVTYIGHYAFSDCSSLEQMLVASGNTVYDSRGNCNAIIKTSTNELVAGCKTTVIPDSVTSIGNDAFYFCSGLTSIEIPNSVISIGSLAFEGCTGLTSIEIPNSVTSIERGAFWGCSNLTDIVMLGTIPPSFGSDVYIYTNNCPIYVPYESVNDYKTATNWSDYENRIFPMAYTTIPGYGEGEGNYRFIASPLVANTAPTAVDNMITETAYDLYRFDQSENDEWQNYKYPENTPNFFLTNGQGYLYANAEDVNLIFKGTFNEDETKEVDLVYDANASFAGWNLVGNPFPVNAYANKSYYTMNEEGTAIEPVAVSMETTIPACTGVMVMAEAEGETVVFSTEAPEAATNQGCLQIELSQAVELVEMPTRKQDGPSTGSGTLLDKAIVSFNAGDRLEKFVFNKENAVISIPQGGKELAIACSDKQGEIPLNFKASKNGEYTLTIHPEAVELDYLHLIDNLTGADVDLLSPAGTSPSERGLGGVYTFTAKTTDYASRFRLVFSGKEADGPSSGSETFAFVNNGNIIITGAEVGATLQIVDMTGRVVASCGGHTRCVPTTGMAKGVYVLRLINGDDVKTQKIVIR